MKIILSDREAELMELLWEHGPSTVQEVQARVADDLAYTTILTFLRNLESKGYVSHETEGRAHRYVAMIDRDAARRSALDHLSAKLFKGSAELMLTHAVSDRSLSAVQVKRIRALLDRRGRKGKP